MGRLFLVSNRLPVSAKSDAAGQVTLVRSSGGLIAGLGPLHDQGDGEWIGSLGSAAVAPEVERELAKQRLAQVTADPDDTRRHYEGYSNTVLWPLFHYLLEQVTFDPADFEAYRRVNERFAEVVAARVRPGDSVWVHDYHLMLLPQLLRERLPDTPIGFFLHIPFPSSEVLRILPRKEEILRGLLGANLIGVHTYSFARHMVSSFRRILGVDFDEGGSRETGPPCRIGVFPLGVDVRAHRALASSGAVEDRLEILRRQIGRRKVILGVDRLDYTKGIPLRLRAFRELLQRRPELRKRVVLVQLAVPSRETLVSYRELKDEVDALVGGINGELEQDGVVPIHYLYRSVPPEELAALYRMADVMLVTPIRDGMNLVCKEYLASRLSDDGVVVLSEFAGAVTEFGEALLHNPYDIDGTAQVIEKAIEMSPEEQARRMRPLRERVALNDVHRWVAHFLAAFDKAAEELVSWCSVTHHHERRSVARLVWVPQLVADFAAAQRPFVALDYDGTLVPIAPTPERATPTQEVLQLLTQLSRVAEVVVVSGRDPRALRGWLDGLPVHVIAEHGLHYRPPEGGEFRELIPALDTSWRDAVREVLDDSVWRAPGSFVEEKVAGLAWHYRRVEPGFGEWIARELSQHLSETFANQPLAVMHGAKVVEVRPQGLNKGRGLLILMRQLGDLDFLMAAGDDRTDEDMFTVLPPDAYTIEVGRAESQARFRLASPEDLASVLGRMIAARVSKRRLHGSAGALHTPPS